MTTLGDIQVLVVDDNQQMRFLVRSLLRAAGVHRVAEATSAIEAFEVLALSQVDLILVDWKMTPVDGIAFTRMVRTSSESTNPYVPILMMTAHTETSRVAAARDSGVTGFLKKPISARVLFDRVSNALLDARMFIKTPSYFGPDRRHGATAQSAAQYAGPLRRATDKPDTIDLDDMRWSA